MPESYDSGEPGLKALALAVTALTEQIERMHDRLGLLEQERAGLMRELAVLGRRITILEAK